jgi:hypothetical protein
MGRKDASSFRRLGGPLPATAPFRRIFCLFSKPVPELRGLKLARSATQAGIGGIDFTLRKEGHVLPQNIEADLPQAAVVWRERIIVSVITREALSADHPNRNAAPGCGRQTLDSRLIQPGY